MACQTARHSSRRVLIAQEEDNMDVKTEDAPIDMDWLRECTDGDSAMIKSMLNLYMERTAALIIELDGAIAANSAPEVRRIAHACLGSSGTCGIVNMAALFKRLEKMGIDAELGDASKVAADVRSEFERVKKFASAI
jgi:HPt (histidine-containing phosphotransfer) domain-containing protein